MGKCFPVAVFRIRRMFFVLLRCHRVTKRPATVVLLSCCRFHRFLDLLFSAVVLSVVLLYYIINISFQLAQEVLNKDYNSSLKPHLHDIHFHFGAALLKMVTRTVTLGTARLLFLPCRCKFFGTRSEKIGNLR